MVQLAVNASSRTHSAYHETYLYPDSLEEFAAKLREFPQAACAEVILESGARDPKVYDYFRMRVFLLKATGQSALEFISEVRADAPVCAEVHFFIGGMPADFNRMGEEITRWLADTSTPLLIEWKSS